MVTSAKVGRGRARDNSDSSQTPLVSEDINVAYDNKNFAAIATAADLSTISGGIPTGARWAVIQPRDGDVLVREDGSDATSAASGGSVKVLQNTIYVLDCGLDNVSLVTASGTVNCAVSFRS
jgi:hypothetical protein